MGTAALINATTGVNRNRGIARINANRLARQMVARYRAAGQRNAGATF